MTDALIERLEPCPFCGGEATVQQLAGGYATQCLNPCVTQREVAVGWFRSETEAITAWNTRHPSRNDVLEEAAKQALMDPDAVHLNMLRGTIAKPSIAQIIHIYGADTLRRALKDRDG